MQWNGAVGRSKDWQRRSAGKLRIAMEMYCFEKSSKEEKITGGKQNERDESKINIP